LLGLINTNMQTYFSTTSTDEVLTIYGYNAFTVSETSMKF